jgi:hypothetical protein
VAVGAPPWPDLGGGSSPRREVAVPDEQNPPRFVTEAVLGFLMGPPVDGPAIDGPETLYFCTFSF